ncbi:unnamed protein product [Euphydryas editha]|uniref:Spaetzle domain-containing protein n=1 Tax=Euphydryas editha TaxID=104508 RepID=A0AAU9V1Q7_EUPED|nr:unnamed protein product [Euphydryas editha]
MFVLAFVFIISAHSLHTTYAAAAVAQYSSKEDRITYPESIDDDEVPEQCKGLTYCTVKPKDYPEGKFKNMFKDYNAVAQPTMIVDLNNRQGGDSDNCESDVSFDPLYKVRENINAPWRTVVQVPEKDFVQRVRLEKCTNENATCMNIFPSQEDYVTYCKQKYNKWEVLVQKGTSETEIIIAELPVCCSCHYKPAISIFGTTKK